MRINNSRLIWYAVAVCVMPLPLHAVAAQSRIASVVIVDSRRQPEAVVQTAESSHSLLNFTRRQVNGGAFTCADAVKDPWVGPKANTPELRQLMALIVCASDPTDATPAPARAAAAGLVAKTAKKHEGESSLRVASLKGDSIRIVVLQTATQMTADNEAVIVRGALPRIKFTEDTRKSQFSTDIETFVRLAAQVVAVIRSDDPDPGLVKDSPVMWLTVADEQLKLRRATLSLEVSPGSGTKVLWSKNPEPEKFLERVDSARAVQQLEAAHMVRCGSQPPSYVTQLACQLNDADQPFAVRMASAKALGESGSAAATAFLRLIAASNEPEALRIAATEALGKLRVTAPTPQAPPQAAQPGQPTATAPTSGSAPQVTKAKLLTGPNEHWFLTADVPVTSAETFAFDEDTDQLDLVEEPSRFYVGIGFLFGDLASETRSFFGNLVLKGMVTLSKRPLDSYGFAVGFRGSYLKRFGVDFETLTPFVGYTYSLEDAVNSAGQVKEKSRRNKQFRFGVSLNLDRATSWMEQ